GQACGVASLHIIGRRARCSVQRHPRGTHAMANEYRHLIYEKDAHRVTLTLNRPERINALNEQLTREFESAMLQAEDDDAVRVIVRKGAGRGFCAGHDYGRENFKPGERETGHDTEAHR